MTDYSFKVSPWRLLALPAALLTLATAAPAARAELVVFTHGKVIKVLSHQVTGDRIEIRLPEGGRLTFDYALVEGIEEDEVPATTMKGPPAEASAGQGSPQPPGHVDTSGSNIARQTDLVAAPTQPDVTPGSPDASEGLRPADVSRRSRRQRR